MDFNINNIAGLALIGSAVAFYKQIQAFIQKIFSLFVRTDTLEIYDHQFLHEILKTSKVIRWGNSKWDKLAYSYICKYDMQHTFVGKIESTLFVIYNKKIPLIIKKTAAGISVTYLYKTFDFEGILKTIDNQVIENSRKFNDQQLSHYWIDDVVGRDVMAGRSESAGSPSQPSKLSDVFASEKNSKTNDYFFEPFGMQDHGKYINLTYSEYIQTKLTYKRDYFWSQEALQLERELSFFKSNRGWFVDRGIPYKRGVLLTGRPGTGKSKMISEVCQKLQIPIRIFNLSNMSDKEFITEYHANGNLHSVILMEDFDNIFNLRENKLAKTSLTKNLLSFDTLLNTISGVKSVNGVFLIITTNHPELLDPALLRPGRLDVRIDVGNICEDGRKFIARNILRDWPELQEQVVAESSNITVAEFENKCIEIALDKFYANKKS